MTRPSDESGSDAAKWWNEKSQEELDKLEFLQKEMMRAMQDNKKMVSADDEEEEEEEDMGPPDLPEDDDEDMSPPDLPEDDDVEMEPADDEDEDEMALEPTDREMDMQDRMASRRDMARRRPKARSRAEGMMKSGAPRDVMSKALRAEMELKRAFSPEKRRDLAQQGLALPDGSFPIVTSTDLKNAIMAFGRAKNKNAAKRHIVKRARALKQESLIPENWSKKDAKGYGMPMGPMSDPMMPMPKKKKKMRYGEKEADMAEMEDDEMASPMSREELMARIFKKKKKKPEMADEDMPEEETE
jgi:hypothetical protein